ncbi:MAG: Crp/Fnr family transcriptional regulator [Bacteroidetes bacterium]|nr:Crp/Fnr family transcriptional regulator [Bacteroidota bacterium]
MDVSLLIASIGKHIKLETKEIDLLLSLLKERRIRKRQYLLQEGDVCKYTAFVNKGCLRSYCVGKNGVEHIFQFAPEGWWTGDIQSFNSQMPSTMNIDALEDSEIFLVSKADMDLFYEKVPKYERFSRIILENAFIAHQERIMQSICFTAAERYDYFCKKYPFLVQRLPQTQIASYLGLTPEFLSKLRRQLLK